MSTVTDRRTTAGAGGKIMRSRRAPAKSPYSRPEKRQEIAMINEPGNPNWLSGLISPAKAIVSGAGKIISFFGSDSPSSSDDDDDENSDDNEDEEVENDSSPRGESQCKVLSPSSKSSNKHAIEQLVMQEKFSREEGDELIKLIKSRIVDDGSLDESALNLRTTAIMEAQKWLQQKRSGSKKRMEHELDITTLASPTKFAEIEKGSPVDMAKSYMQSRPTWTSASKHTDYGSSSPLGILNFNEGTPKSTFRNSEMKRNCLSSGSWNILEELRRVRSKATKEFLAPTPLKNTAKSSLFLQNNQPENSMANNRNVEITVIAESLYDKPQNVKQDVSISHPTGVSQDGNVVQPMERQECLEAQEAADLKSDKEDGMIQLRSTTAENGFPSTASGLNPEVDMAENAEPLEKVNGNLVGSVQREKDVHMENNIANPEQDSAADILNANPDEMVPNGSQNSSSMQLDDEVHELSQPVVVLAAKPKVRAPPEERKSRAYTRSGRAKANK